MVEALRRRGVVVDYMLEDDEGHGFRSEENQIELCRTAERFLGEHLTGKPIALLASIFSSTVKLTTRACWMPCPDRSHPRRSLCLVPV
jgi:hypothetical protein